MPPQTTNCPIALLLLTLIFTSLLLPPSCRRYHLAFPLYFCSYLPTTSWCHRSSPSRRTPSSTLYPMPPQTTNCPIALLLLTLIFTSLLLPTALAGIACPCQDKTLCTHLSLPARPELFAFGIEDYEHYDYTHLTTVALWKLNDPQIFCYAHQRNVRVVLLVTIDVKKLLNITYQQEWLRALPGISSPTLYDGINIDFESPVSRNSPESKALTSLVAAARATYQRSSFPDAQVTLDVAWSADCIDGRCYDYAALAESVDFFVLMDYDQRSQVKVGPCIAYANSDPRLLVSGYSTYRSLGIPNDKMVVGLPWYGYDYPCLSRKNSTICPIELHPFRGVSCSDAAGRQVPFYKIEQQLSSLGIEAQNNAGTP
eukprot:TRINITY_DN9363_c0_g1_i1.p1 TRINITY_DN9363_c0_g1~~TRINITY_DN9363_c0_g1_i1.p1  ORF type:complete len:418 (+),score=31.98 TRINITY_DN9363_c0_g1_i1:145-1254(+)